MDAVAILIYLAGLAVSIAIMYTVIQNAVTNSLREARREQFTEDFYPEKAVWLTERQRAQLAEHNARRQAK
ncbi:hypothetical protein [Microbacterium laevaniformans]|uniref:hypothetical protein n=1 Tax=Microbacterium laevaniformans TaxID=36807 RepID=UPI003635C406